MSKFAAVLPLAAALVLTGCAADMTSWSYAKQVAAFGKLNLQDQRVPSAEYTTFLKDVSTVGLNATTLADWRGLNMSAGSALGLGLAAALFAPKPKEAIDAVLAFPPIELGNEKEVSELVSITIAQASKKAFDELEGFNTSAITPMSFFGKGNIVDGRGPGCAPYCSAMSWYRSPGKGTALKAIYADQRPVYRFTSKEEALRLTRYDTDLFDKAQFLTNLSRHLPEWAYVYAAPVHKKSPPMILHQGQAHYFVSVKQ